MKNALEGFEEFKEDFRKNILEAMDDASENHGVAMALDEDLPALFKALDSLALLLWSRQHFIDMRN